MVGSPGNLPPSLGALQNHLININMSVMKGGCYEYQDIFIMLIYHLGKFKGFRNF